MAALFKYAKGRGFTMTFKLFLDPGHGGKDSGAVGNGLKEKDLTLKIAKKIKDLLAQYEGVSVKMSRTGDTYPTLTERTNAANAWGADFFLSIHINSGGGTGYEDYRYIKCSASSKTGQIQSAIHSAVYGKMKSYGIRDRGKKAADLHVCRESAMDALLTENLFIDSPSDAKLLKQDKFLDAVAKGHVDGLAKAFGLKKKNSSMYHTVVKGDTLWGIARANGTTVAKIKDLNSLKADTIYPGQNLRVK